MRNAGGLGEVCASSSAPAGGEFMGSKQRHPAARCATRLVESHPDSRFAIDLSGVNDLASSEIGFLVSLKRRIDRRQGRVVIFGVGPYILEIFQTMNLVKILDVVEDHRPGAVPRLLPDRAGAHLPTTTVFSACSLPASGPESNSAVTLTAPKGCDWGTRTEAVQNVPQAKPECARARIWPSVVARATRAPRVSWTAGEIGTPR
ncbi:MAG: STAS domain-containing protein [Isosphaerales bacterium]